jgi:hypothetical protein
VGLRAGLDRCGKSRPTGFRSPDRPAPRQSLYRLRYPAHMNYINTQYFLDIGMVQKKEAFKSVSDTPSSDPVESSLLCCLDQRCYEIQCNTETLIYYACVIMYSFVDGKNINHYLRSKYRDCITRTL